MGKFIYSFNEGSKKMRNLLGANGANLAEMTKLGLPVPFGFTVSTNACNSFFDNDKKLSEEIIYELKNKMIELEEVTSKKFDDDVNPLFVSVRSSAIVNVPGVKDSILNLGLSDKSVKGLAHITQNEEFAYDSYRKFIENFSRVIFGISQYKFDGIYEEHMRISERNIIDTGMLSEIIKKYKELFFLEIGIEFPQDTQSQLELAIASFLSVWNNVKAIQYREKNHIGDDMGIAVNVQAMVFGNVGNNSCTGIAFTRNPVIGDNHIFGEFLINAQDMEDFSGVNAPMPISKMPDFFPKMYQDLIKIAHILEKHYRDMQEMEFTIENQKLYMLKTGRAKRTPESAIKIAVDMVNESLITKEQAIMRISTEQIEQLLNHYFDQIELERDSESKLEMGTVAESGNRSVLQFVDYFNTIMKWSGEIKNVKVVAEADNIVEAMQALELGTEGIGLCRTECMLVGEDTIFNLRKMILSDKKSEQLEAMKKILPYQKSNFSGIYEVMGNRPVGIRLLDPLLNIFMPQTEQEIKDFAEKTGMPYDKIFEKIEKQKGKDLMMGVRGARLAIMYPELVKLQVEAIIGAAIDLKNEKGISANPEIIVPFVSSKEEFEIILKNIRDTANEVMDDYETEIVYQIGIMVETPRAAILADQFADLVDFMIFGTNDLTQMLYGLSEYASEDIIESYNNHKIFDGNPFLKLDIDGVGKLIKDTFNACKAVKPNIRIGICGKHMSDKFAIDFLDELGVNYICCEFGKTPLVKLAVAQAKIKH